MKWLNDFFAPKDLDYPTVIVSSPGDPNKDVREGVLVRWFAPKLLPYPIPFPTGAPTTGVRDPRTVVPGGDGRVPVIFVPVPAGGTVQGGADPSTTVIAAPLAPTPSVPSQDSMPTVALVMPALQSQPAPAQAAVAPVQQPAQVIAPAQAQVQAPAPAQPAAQVQAPVQAQPAPPVATQTQAPAQVAAQVQAPAMQAAPLLLALAGGSGVSRTLRGYSFNPEFAGPSACRSIFFDDADDLDFDGDLDLISLLSEWVTVDSQPIVFVVPDGCDSVDLTFGPVEVNPGVGCDSDLDLPVMSTNEARLSAPSGCGCSIDGLTPGDQLLVTVPWRASAALSLPAGRLRQRIRAEFFRSGEVR
jgi:hypothetical protein